MKESAQNENLASLGNHYGSVEGSQGFRHKNTIPHESEEANIGLEIFLLKPAGKRMEWSEDLY